MKKIFVLLTAAALGVLMVSCGHEIGPGNTKHIPAVINGVKTQTATLEGQPLIYNATGTVRSGSFANISAKTMGEVRQVLVEEGDTLKAGEPLAYLDPTQLEAGLAQAKAGRSAAYAQSKLARATYKRYKTLHERNSVSEQEFDMVEADYLRAQAAGRQARAAFESAKDMLDDAAVVAPFDGVVSQKMVDVGDLAAPGRPLFAMETGGGFRVDLVVSEAHIGSIKKGQKVKVHIDAAAQKTFDGTVTAVAPAADPRSRSFLVKVSLPEDDRIKSGMFARTAIKLGEADGMLIPISSVVRRGQLTAVYTVDEENITHYRLVRLGKDYGTQVEVLSGLKTGARYVISPPPEMKDGMKLGAEK